MAAAPVFADYVENVRINAEESVRIAIPARARFALFSFDADVRVKPGTAATVIGAPATSTADGSGSELNPTVRRIPPLLGDNVTEATHLCLWAPAAASGSISFYA